MPNDGTAPLGAPASNGASGRHAAGQGNHAGSATHSGTRDLDAIACAGDAVLRLRIRHVPALVSAFDLRRTRICTTPDPFDLRETGRCRHPRSPPPVRPDASTQMSCVTPASPPDRGSIRSPRSRRASTAHRAREGCPNSTANRPATRRAREKPHRAHVTRCGGVGQVGIRMMSGGRYPRGKRNQATRVTRFDKGKSLNTRAPGRREVIQVTTDIGARARSRREAT